MLITHLVKMIFTQIMNKYMFKSFIPCLVTQILVTRLLGKFTKFHHDLVQWFLILTKSPKFSFVAEFGATYFPCFIPSLIVV
jgi:hypothetical protein